MARALARLTGESVTAAVTEAVRERLDRVRHGEAMGLADRLVAIGKDARRGSKSRSEALITASCFTMSAACRGDHRHVRADRDPS